MLQAQSDKIKLQLCVEELQHKYEPKGNNATITTIMKMKDVAAQYNTDLTTASVSYI